MKYIKWIFILIILASLTNLFIVRNNFIYFDTISFENEELNIKYKYKWNVFNSWLDIPTRRKFIINNKNTNQTIKFIPETCPLGINSITFKTFEVTKQKNLISRKVLFIDDTVTPDFAIDLNSLTIIDTLNMAWFADSSNWTNENCIGRINYNQFEKDNCIHKWIEDRQTKFPP